MITTTCFGLQNLNSEISTLEQKLKRFSQDLQKDNCNQEKVASLFVEGTKILEQIKTIERSIDNKNGDHTAAFITINQLTTDLKKIISKIELFHSQCSNLRKKYASLGETTSHNQTQVQQISIAKQPEPIYNNPSNSSSEEMKETSTTTK